MNLKKILTVVSVTIMASSCLAADVIEALEKINEKITQMRQHEPEKSLEWEIVNINDCLKVDKYQVRKDKYATEQQRLTVFESFFHVACSGYEAESLNFFTSDENQLSQDHVLRHFMALWIMRKAAFSLYENPTNYNDFLKNISNDIGQIIPKDPKDGPDKKTSDILREYKQDRALRVLLPESMIKVFIKACDFPDVENDYKLEVQGVYEFINWTCPPRQEQDVNPIFPQDPNKGKDGPTPPVAPLPQDYMFEYYEQLKNQQQLPNDAAIARSAQEEEDARLAALLQGQPMPASGKTVDLPEKKTPTKTDAELALELQMKELSRAPTARPQENSGGGQQGPVPAYPPLIGKQANLLFAATAAPTQPTNQEVREDRELFGNIYAAYRPITERQDVNVHDRTSFTKNHYQSIKRLEQTYFGITNDKDLLNFDQINSKVLAWLPKSHLEMNRKPAVLRAMNLIRGYYNTPTGADAETGVDLKELFSHVCRMAEEFGQEWQILDKLAENIETGGGCHPGVSGRFGLLYFFFLSTCVQNNTNLLRQ